MKKRKLAVWWKVVFALILALAALNFITYSMGGSGVRVKGSKPSIDHSADYQYFKINEKYAFTYSPKYKATDFITYQKTSGLYRLFGDYERNKTIFAEPSKNGDWIYTTAPGFYEKGRIIAVNVKTNEEIIKQEPKSDDLNFFPANLKSKGLSKDQNRIINERDFLNLEALDVPKESAITLFGGLMLALVLWLLLLPFAFKKININP